MIQILPMTPEWVPSVAALEALCFRDPWSARSIAGELNNPLSCWLVAVQEGVAVGYVGSQTVLGETDMMNLAVCPEYRRQGIARMLVEELITRLAERGSHSLTLEVRQSNEAARALYESLGFAQVGRRPRYYYNPREDALILRKEWAI